MNREHGFLRMRTGHQHNRVTFVELFFDLVFVFAITQLSHTLIEHFTLAGGVEVMTLLCAVWCVWIYTAWATNWLDPENVQVRILLFVLMLAGLILSASIPKAFDSRGLAFAAAYVFIQLSRTAFVFWSFRGRGLLTEYRNFLRILIWLIVSSLFWLAGGFAEDGARLGFWIIAIILEFVSPALGYWVPILGRSSTSDWNIEGAHMAERCGLFIIIVLGESILVTGAIFSNLEWTAPTVIAFVASFVGSVMLWWLYFDRTSEAASEIIAHSDDPGRLGRSAYTYSHICLVAGIILLAVSDEFVLSHPTGHTEVETTIVRLGGTALYLIGNLLVKWTVWGRLRISHIYGLTALALLIPASNVLSPMMMMIATSAVLVGIAVWEIFYYRQYWEEHPVSTHTHPEQAQ